MPIKEEVLNVFRQMVEEEGDNQAKAAARERAAVYKEMVDKLMGRRTRTLGKSQKKFRSAE